MFYYHSSLEGRRLVSNSSDKILRQFNLPIYDPPKEGDSWIENELEPTHKFIEPINKYMWNAMSYSPDGEWLAGGTSSLRVLHDISSRIHKVHLTHLDTKYMYGICPMTASSLMHWMEGASHSVTYT